MATYKISNSNGKSGGVWSRSYSTRGEAARAIADGMGWDDVVLSHSFTSDGDDGEDLTAWCAYETQEECDADQDGARAPCVTRHDGDGSTVEA